MVWRSIALLTVAAASLSTCDPFERGPRAIYLCECPAGGAKARPCSAPDVAEAARIARGCLGVGERTSCVCHAETDLGACDVDGCVRP